MYRNVHLRFFFFKIEKEYTSKLACMYIENVQKDEAKWQNQLPLWRDGCGQGWRFSIYLFLFGVLNHVRALPSQRKKIFFYSMSHDPGYAVIAASCHLRERKNGKECPGKQPPPGGEQRLQDQVECEISSRPESCMWIRISISETWTQAVGLKAG